MLSKQEKRDRRRKRTRAKIFGTARRPRLSVFRSNKHIYAQLINDEKGKILIACSDLKPKVKNAKDLGKLIAEKAQELKIEKVVFDRREYKYHGRVKALAEGAREGGLKF